MPTSINSFSKNKEITAYEKETFTTKLIKRFYGIQGPLDEFKLQKAMCYREYRFHLVSYFYLYRRPIRH
ncbi:DUF3278 domain-containing protein [Streptococcus dentasini]